MKKVKARTVLITVLLYTEITPERIGILIEVKRIDGLLKYSVMSIRRGDQIDACLSRKIVVDSRLIGELETYQGNKGWAPMVGKLAEKVASAVDDVLKEKGITQLTK